jgi:hypothetical protein
MQHASIAVAANVASWQILVTLMMEAIDSSVTVVRTSVTQCNITEDSILHKHLHEIFKSYIMRVSILVVVLQRSSHS